MNTAGFKLLLNNATNKVVDETKKVVKNKLSPNIEFIIEPNSREKSDHLNTQEIALLSELNALKNEFFTADEVVQLLFHNELVPLWINTEVFQSQKEKTIVKLIISRRLRPASALFTQIDEFAPFHLLIPTPPWYEKGKKFDINWSHNPFKKKCLSYFHYRKVMKKINEQRRKNETL